MWNEYEHEGGQSRSVAVGVKRSTCHHGCFTPPGYVSLTTFEEFFVVSQRHELGMSQVIGAGPQKGGGSAIFLQIGQLALCSNMRWL